MGVRPGPSVSVVDEPADHRHGGSDVQSGMAVRALWGLPSRMSSIPAGLILFRLVTPPCPRGDNRPAAVEQRPDRESDPHTH